MVFAVEKIILEISVAGRSAVVVSCYGYRNGTVAKLDAHPVRSIKANGINKNVCFIKVFLKIMGVSQCPCISD